MKNIISFEQVLDLAKQRMNNAFYYVIRKHRAAFTGNVKSDVALANSIIDCIKNNNTAHTNYSALKWAYDRFYGVKFNSKYLHQRSGEVSKFTTRFDIDQIRQVYILMKEWCLAKDITWPPIKKLTRFRRLRTFHGFNILLHSGMRCGEFTSIDFQNIKINRELVSSFTGKSCYEIIINTEKTCKKREVYVPKESFDFYKHSDKVSKYTLRDSLNDFYHWSKLPYPVTAHVCRRSLATLMHECGVDVPTIAMVLGNTVAVCLRHYIISSKRNWDACEIAHAKFHGGVKQSNNMYADPHWMVKVSDIAFNHKLVDIPTIS